MAKLFLIDVENDDLKLVKCEELDDYYKHLGCDCFDIANRKVGSERYDIFVDDCGLFRDNPTLSAIDSEGQPMLVGNLILARHDSEGNTISLRDSDVKNILSNMVRLFTESRPTGYFALMCDY